MLFAGVVLYAFWPGNKKRFDEAAKLPLEDDPEADKQKDS
ncbi:MAG: cbb3-type cytochrome c oxidase subunit 3 [Methyloceanibacter sp.]